jgi:RNA polymerase sigma-70 factor, ECF subfamily
MIYESKMHHVFESVALPHRDELLGSAMKMTRDEAEAEDLVQETLLRAFTFFGRFEQGTNCRAWLFRILTNTFINRYRRKVKEHEVLANDEFLEGSGPSFGVVSRQPMETPEAALSVRQINGEIYQALMAIPEVFRFVVVLADLQGFSYRDVSIILDCPVGTVMSRLYRGRRMLRTRLKGFVAREQAGMGTAGKGLKPMACRCVA